MLFWGLVAGGHFSSATEPLFLIIAYISIWFRLVANLLHRQIFVYTLCVPRQSIIYEVLLASPSDVPRERDVLTQVVAAWNSANSRTNHIFLQTLRWELDTVPASGSDAQSVITKQIVEHADILLAVFWTRLGTKTKKAASGTVAEIKDFKDKNKDFLIYFSNSPIPIAHDEEQFRQLMLYKKRIAANTYYAEFSDLGDLYEKASRHLASVVNKIIHSKAVASIISPNDQAVVGSRVLVVGKAGIILQDNRLWLVVELESGHLYPQSRLKIDQGEWSHTVRIGVLESGGSKDIRFLIRLVSVGPVSDYEFQKYALGESGRPDYLRIDWPVDTTILDTRVVIRGD